VVEGGTLDPKGPDERVPFLEVRDLMRGVASTSVGAAISASDTPL
jgi:hypothetical protein